MLKPQPTLRGIKAVGQNLICSKQKIGAIKVESGVPKLALYKL